MGQGATAAQQSTKTKKQNASAASAAANAARRYSSATSATASPGGTPPPVNTTTSPGSGTIIPVDMRARFDQAIQKFQLDQELNVSDARSLMGMMQVMGVFALAKTDPAPSPALQAKIDAFIAKTDAAIQNPANPLPTATEALDLAEKLITEGLCELAIEMATQGPHLVPPEAPPTEFLQALIRSSILLYSIYMQCGDLASSAFHEVLYFRYKALAALLSSESANGNA